MSLVLPFVPLKLENALQAFDLRLQYGYTKEDHLL